MHLSKRLRRLGVVAVAIIAGTAVGFALSAGSGASASASPGSRTMAAMSMTPGHGENDFGMTHAFFHGHSARFTYSHGYFCDTSVSAQSSTKCEVGQKWNHAPSAQHDPLFITVPLGFKPKKMVDCPANLTCVDHPMTVDMTRLEPALKPLYPQFTDAQLTDALKNFMTPGHDHFITTKNGGRREWWDVRVVGVTSPAVYKKIKHHQSFSYIQKLIKHKNKNVVGPIPSNIFLFFSVQR
jgi:hypothetical protein